jgi:hypothetical protein
MSKNMDQYINDHLIIYENKKATPEETEAALKRINAKEKISETYFQDKLPKKLSKQDEYNIYFNKKSPKYYNKEKGDFLTLQEKAKKLKALHAKKPKPNIQLNNPLSNPETDNFLELIDSGGWASPEDQGKRRVGLLEYELADEYWQSQYEDYINGGGTLTYQQFLQIQFTKKVNKKINEIAEERKQGEGLATLVGAPEEVKKILFNDKSNKKIPKKI